jgi:hypothetical protein
MSEFRTIVRPRPSSSKIYLKSKVFTIGSCFADAIGNRLKESKFDAMVSPYGTTFNPISIHKAVSYGLWNRQPGVDTFLTRDDIHLNYDFHSSFAAEKKEVLVASIAAVNNASHVFLERADYVLITYGTSWVYERIQSGEIVNNCHKMPGHNFSKRLLSEKEIIESFVIVYKELKKFNPSAKIILTLSPVRHLKDTLELNSVSKSVLRSACHNIVSTMTDVQYFPAYEMMMDDLRDYRFYKSDMLHPTQQAEDYIWDSFKQTYFDAETLATIEALNKIRIALSHKAFNPTSSSHQQFLKQTLLKLLELKDKINVEAEIAAVQTQIQH